MNKLFPLVVFLTFPILCFGCDKDNEIKYMNTKSHLALPVEDIEKAKNFYVDVFRVPVNEGSTPEGNPVYALEIGPIIISFNQLPKVEMSEVNSIPNDILKLNKIRDTYFVSSQHWGLYNLTKNEFDGIIQRLKKNEARFIIEPIIVNANTDHVQHLAFACDPQGYVMEIRSSSAQRGFQAKEFEQQDPMNKKTLEDASNLTN